MAACAGGVGIASAQTAQPDVVRDVVEPASGARVRIYRAPLGEAVFDVSSPRVTIGKRVERGASVTIVSAGAERIVLRVTPSRVVVDGLGERLELARGSRADADRLRARIASSSAIKEAVSLLAEGIHVLPEQTERSSA